MDLDLEPVFENGLEHGALHQAAVRNAFGFRLDRITFGINPRRAPGYRRFTGRKPHQHIVLGRLSWNGRFEISLIGRPDEESYRATIQRHSICREDVRSRRRVLGATPTAPAWYEIRRS